MGKPHCKKFCETNVEKRMEKKKQQLVLEALFI